MTRGVPRWHLARLPAAALAVLALGGLSACNGAPQPAATPPASAATDVGVAECDQYLRKQRECYLSRLAPEALASANQTLEATRLKWRAMKTDPRTSASLAMTCGIAMRDATTALQELGCSW